MRINLTHFSENSTIYGFTLYNGELIDIVVYDRNTKKLKVCKVGGVADTYTNTLSIKYSTEVKDFPSLLFEDKPGDFIMSYN